MPPRSTPDLTPRPTTIAFSGTVSVIDTSSNTVADTITVGAAPDGLAVSADGRRAYTANFNSDTVSVIDTT